MVARRAGRAGKATGVADAALALGADVRASEGARSPRATTSARDAPATDTKSMNAAQGRAERSESDSKTGTREGETGRPNALHNM